MRVIVYTVDSRVTLHETHSEWTMGQIMEVLSEEPEISWLAFDEGNVVYRASNIVKIVAVDEDNL